MKYYRDNEAVGTGRDTNTRPSTISKQELDLKWELAFCKSKKRKEAIKRELERLQREV